MLRKTRYFWILAVSNLAKLGNFQIMAKSKGSPVVLIVAMYFIKGIHSANPAITAQIRIFKASFPEFHLEDCIFPCIFQNKFFPGTIS